MFRSTLPEADRLSPERVVDALVSVGVDAEYIPETEAIVRRIARRAEPGDLVVVMSNGGFDNIHQRLLSALEAREAR